MIRTAATRTDTMTHIDRFQRFLDQLTPVLILSLGATLSFATIVA
jgi:hypothetical protein